MNKILVILGATGTGKTFIADRICQRIGDAEIISADSRQIYRYLNIGTNKSITKTTQHLIDIIDPDEIFSAGDFFSLASEKIREIKNSNRIPVVVGGTGLYIKTLMDGGLTKLPSADWSLRKQLSVLSPEELYQKLQTVDPESALKNRHNPHRLIRAIEVYHLTRVPLSVWHAQSKNQYRQQEERKKYICIGLTMDKNILHKRIYERAKWMVENGIIEETKKVLNMGFSQNCPAFKSIGYRYVFDFIGGKINSQELIEKIFADTKKYIKRQITWFKKEPHNIKWIDTTNLSINSITDEIFSHLKI